ncbi:MAG: sel1 repeat family protein [Clostridia bacterium]|nr:sel1 repeat family protein [Clostridia bacterium]
MGAESMDKNIRIKDAELILIAQKHSESMDFDSFNAENPNHIIKVGMYCIDVIGEKETGLKLTDMAAQSGCAEAQFIMGNFCYYGTCGEVDYEMAVYWFQRSADQGNIGGLNNLGHCLLDGIGCPKNEKKGFDLIKKAAERNSIEAFEGMGHCYYNGINVDRDLLTAKAWWEKAAIRGNKIAWDKLLKFFPCKRLSAVPYEILKNCFNSANFEPLFDLLSEDAVYRSEWIKDQIQGKPNIQEHLRKISERCFYENGITHAELAFIKGLNLNQTKLIQPQVGQFCIEMKFIYNESVVLLEGHNNIIEKIEIVNINSIEYELIENSEVLEREGVYACGVEIVRQYMFHEKYRILSYTRKEGAFPQIRAERDGINYIIIVGVEVAPFMGRLKKSVKQQIVKIAKEYDAIPCFASVGIGCEDRMCFDRGIVLRNVEFNFNFKGLDIIEGQQTMN